MSSMLFRYSVQHHLQHRLRLFLVILSLALGVAIFVSSFESIVAARDAIERSSNAMVSKADWRVSRGLYLGIEESAVEGIRHIPGVVAAPLIEDATLAGPPINHRFLILGIDLDSDAMTKLYDLRSNQEFGKFLELKFGTDAMLIPAATAAKSGLKKGDTVKLDVKDGRRSVPIIDLIDDPRIGAAGAGYVGFMDLHAAENLLQTPGRVDRIDVRGGSKAQIEAACPGCQVDPPNRLSSAAGDALGRIDSLLGVSVIALLVGLLLIYNSVQVSVLERLKDVAVLRSIGATRSQILKFLLVEWLVIALLGSAAGILIGSTLAYVLLEYTKRTINTMMPLIADAHVQVGPALLAAGVGIGLVTTLGAAVCPILAAAKVQPLEVLRPYSYRRHRRYLASALAGVAVCIVGNVVIATTTLQMVPGLCVTGIVFLGVALLFPQIVLSVAALVRPALRKCRMSIAFLALDGLIKAPHRTAFTIMTFGAALAMLIATNTLVEGFHVSTGEWMNVAFPFDISVMGNDLASSVYGNEDLPSGLAAEARQVPGVAWAYGVRKLMTPFKGNDVMAIGADLDGYTAARKSKNLGYWPPSLADPAVRQAFFSGSGAFVSTNFSKLYNVQTGSTITFQTPTGPVKFKVLGIIDDYSWPHGCFITGLSTIRSRWHDGYLSYVDVSVKPGASIQDVKQRLIKMAGRNRSAFAFDRHEISEVTDSVIQQGVAIADIQALIAILIGLLGIVNAAWIGVINRKREIALWRSIGVTRRQVGLILTCEAFFLSFVAVVIGVIGGLYGGWAPLRAFSFAITGYLYPIVVPWAYISIAGLVALVCGTLAGVGPARHAAKLPVLESIGYE